MDGKSKKQRKLQFGPVYILKGEDAFRTGYYARDIDTNLETLAVVYLDGAPPWGFSIVIKKENLCSHEDLVFAYLAPDPNNPSGPEVLHVMK